MRMFDVQGIEIMAACRKVFEFLREPGNAHPYHLRLHMVLRRRIEFTSPIRPEYSVTYRSGRTKLNKTINLQDQFGCDCLSGLHLNRLRLLRPHWTISATGCSGPGGPRKSMKIVPCGNRCREVDLWCRSNARSTHPVLRQCEIVVQRARPERLAKPRERERTHGKIAHHQTRVRLRCEKPAEPDRSLLFA